MPDSLSPSQRHACMSHIRSKNTKPEVKLRKELFMLGYRYRINKKGLPGSPDIVLPKYRTAIFVNGCFWHGHKDCKYYTVPETNTEFWTDKVSKNKERDALNNQRLESLSWSIITIWECELKPKAFDDTMDRLTSQLHENKAKWEQYCQRRRSDREFARAEARRKRQIRAEVERELQELFHIPVKIRRISHDEND